MLDEKQKATLVALVAERKAAVRTALASVSDVSYAFSLLVQEEQHLNDILKVLYSKG